MAEPNTAPQADAKSSPRNNSNRASGSGKRKESYLPETHRTLPQSIDAEKGVLCSILLSPSQVLDQCIEQQVSKEHFHQASHATLYEVLRELGDANKPIDLVTVTQELTDRKLLDAIGGAAVLADLFTFIPTAANADYYLQILREKYLLRQCIFSAKALLQYALPRPWFWR